MQRHEDPDPAAQQLLATANADPAVSAAANLNALPTLRAAWDQALGP